MGPKRGRGELEQEVEQFLDRLRSTFGDEWFDLGDARQLLACSRQHARTLLTRGVRLKRLEQHFEVNSLTDEYRVRQPAATEEDGEP